MHRLLSHGCLGLGPGTPGKWFLGTGVSEAPMATDLLVSEAVSQVG